MTSWVRYVAALAIALALVGLGFAGLITGPVAMGPILPLVILVLDTPVLFAFAVGLFAVSLLLYLSSLHAEDPSRLVSAGPEVEALVPVYDDSAVLHRSVEGLIDSEYGNLTVTVVAEPDDRASIDRAAELAAEHDDVAYLVNEARQGTKAGALNTAIERSDADIVGLFDADQQPHPKLLAHAVAYLQDHDAVRVRSLPKPTDGVIESEAYYEYLLLFFLPQKLARFVLGFQIVGTRSVLLRREVFEEVGLFNEETLTEDIDFTHKCHQAGVSIRELCYYPCFEEAPHRLDDWWWQRVRWVRGHVEVGHDHLQKWRNLFDPAFLGSLVTLAGTFAAGVLLAFTLPKLALAGLSSPVFVGTALATLYAVALATRAVDNRVAGTDGFELSWLLMPAFFSLYGLVIVQVLVGYVVGWDAEWYQVDKQA